MIDFQKVLRMRKLTGQFISISDCSSALALSNHCIYDAILLLHNRKITSFTNVLKLNCRNLKGYRRACTIKSTKLVYKAGALWDLVANGKVAEVVRSAGTRPRLPEVPYKQGLDISLIPTCNACFNENADDSNLVVSIEQFKRIINGEDFNTVCPEILAYQIVDS